MNDEPNEPIEEQHPEYDGKDADAPFVTHIEVADAEHAYRAKKHHAAERYIKPALRSVGFIVVGIWNKVFINSQLWMVLATVAIAVSTGIYTRYAWRQWKAISDEIPIARDSAKAAQVASISSTESAKQATQAMHISNRARMAVHVGRGLVVTGSTLTMPISIVNEGATSAFNIRGQMAVNVLPDEERLNFRFGHGHPVYSIDAHALPPKDDQSKDFAVLPKYLPEHAPWQTVTVTKELHEAVDRGDVYITVYGNLRYEDIFGISHWLKFCTYAQSGTIGTTKKVAGADECSKYYDEDRNY